MSFKEILQSSGTYIKDMTKRMIALEKKEREERKIKTAQAELEKQLAQRNQAIRLLSYQLDSPLRSLIAKALNALSVSMRVSTNDIDCLAISNVYNGSVWGASINVCDTSSYNRSKLNHLKECLQDIIDNMNKEAVKSFNDYLYNDSLEFSNMIIEAQCSNTPMHKNEGVFIRNYAAFYNSNSYKLLRVKVIDITKSDSTLTIVYTVDTSAYEHYQAGNYLMLFNTVINCI